jgi:biopolymer transport protein ExbD
MHIEIPARRRTLLSLTPLIDVVFILLVFFMLVSSFVQWRAISVDVPAEGDGTASDEPVWVLAVYPDGKLELNGVAAARAQALAQVTEGAATIPERTLLLQPRGEVALQTLVGLLEDLSAAGARNVQLARDR